MSCGMGPGCRQYNRIASGSSKRAASGSCSPCRAKDASMTALRGHWYVDRRPAAAILLFFAIACASSPAVAPRTQVRLEPAKAAPEYAAPLPALPALSGDVSISEGSTVRLADFTAVNQDLGNVVRVLAGK